MTARKKRPTRSATRRRLPYRAADDRATSAVLPRLLRERADAAARALNWTFAEVLRVALNEWLDRNAPQTRGAAR